MQDEEFYLADSSNDIRGLNDVLSAAHQGLEILVSAQATKNRNNVKHLYNLEKQTSEIHTMSGLCVRNIILAL